jgi:hypothetical protein
LVPGAESRIPSLRLWTRERIIRIELSGSSDNMKIPGAGVPGGSGHGDRGGEVDRDGGLWLGGGEDLGDFEGDADDAANLEDDDFEKDDFEDDDGWDDDDPDELGEDDDDFEDDGKDEDE